MDFLEDARTTMPRSWNTTIDVASGSADTSAQPSSSADPSSESPALAKDSADTMFQQGITPPVDAAAHPTDLTKDASSVQDVPQ